MALIPFDDRDGTIWFDGAMVPWRDAKIHVLSHGLHYASGVFEGERCYAGNIFKLRDHTRTPDPLGCDPRHDHPLYRGSRSTRRAAPWWPPTG